MCVRACVRASVRACVCEHAGVAALQEKAAAEAGIDQVLKRLPVRILKSLRCSDLTCTVNVQGH